MCLLLTVSIAGFSQTGNPMYEKGYSGNISFVAAQGYRFKAMLLTSHGYRFGNGCFIGIGTGFTSDFTKTMELPLFMDIRYSFLKNSDTSPFLGLKTGYVLEMGFFRNGFIASPEIGFGIGKMTVSIGYTFEYFPGYDSMGSGCSLLPACTSLISP